MNLILACSVRITDVQLSELWRLYFIPHVDVHLPLHLLYIGRVCKALQLGLPFMCRTVPNMNVIWQVHCNLTVGTQPDSECIN